MGEIFNEETLAKALVLGIEKKQPDGTFKRVPGFVSLAYIHRFGEYVLAYGTGQSDADYVLLKDYLKTWRVANA